MNTLLEKLNTSRKAYRLGDLFDLQYGFGLPERDRKNGTVPVYGSSGVVGYHSDSAVKKSAVVIGRKGNVGSVFYAESASYPIDTAYFIDNPHKGFNLKYIYYLLNRVNLPRYGGDSAVPGLSRDAVYSIDVAVPDLAAQKKIAEILGAYDTKIKNNNVIIKNLEATAQAIFNEWFVEFRFPGYEKVKMVNSELGLIPEGWGVKKISDFCKTYGGGTPSTKNPEYWEDGDVFWATPTDMTALSSIFIDNTENKITKSGVQNSSTRILPVNTILMTSRATVGILAIAKVPISTNQGFVTCVCAKIEETYFLFHWLTRNVKLIQSLATGSTFPEISRGVFRNIEILIPDKSIQSAFYESVNPAHELIYLLQKENRSLKVSRDQLLKKLI